MCVGDNKYMLNNCNLQCCEAKNNLPVTDVAPPKAMETYMETMVGDGPAPPAPAAPVAPAAPPAPAAAGAKRCGAKQPGMKVNGWPSSIPMPSVKNIAYDGMGILLGHRSKTLRTMIA